MLAAAQVNVVDYKFGQDLLEADLEESREAVGKLLDSLRTNTNFIPKGKDKTIADISLNNQEIGTRLSLMLRFGKPDDPFFKPFDLPLPQQYRGRSVRDLHEALTGMCKVDPGGNVANMIRNMTHAMACEIVPSTMEIALYSTQEPIFQMWFEALPSEIRDRIHLTPLSTPARKGLHLPYPTGVQGETGTMGIGTPMHSTIREMEQYFPDIARANHVLTSESLTPLVNTQKLREQYQEFQNASSAFRQQCAIESYNHVLNNGHFIPIITNNDAEMKEYVASLQKRRSAPNSGPSTLSFSAPFDAERQLNMATVSDVSSSFEQYFTCITPKSYNKLSFPVCVSCGSQGGYHVACTQSGERVIVFSSIPHSEGATKILAPLGGNSEIQLSKQHTMGAGDSVATVLSLSQIWDTEGMMRQFARKTDPLDPQFIETATIIFVSMLSRVAGELLFHSNKCDWSSVQKNEMQHYIQVTAAKSLDMAQSMWKGLPSPQTARDADWNIDVAMWKM